MITHYKTKALSLGALVAFSTSASAVTVYEGFDYEAGILTGNGGSNWSTAWQTADDTSVADAEFYVSDPGLNFTGLNTIGGLAGRTNSTNNRGWATRTIGGSTQTGLTGGSETWFSFLYDSSGGEDFAFLFGDFGHGGLTGGSNPTLTAAGDAFGFAVNGSDASTITFDNSTSQALGTTSNIGTDTVFIVGKITWDDVNNGGSDVLELFNPGNTTTAEGDLTAFSTSIADLTQSGFDTVGIWDRPNSIGLIDEIRLASTYDEVRAIPEPSTAMLTGLAGLGLMLRRRR